MTSLIFLKVVIRMDTHMFILWFVTSLKLVPPPIRDCGWESCLLQRSCGGKTPLPRGRCGRGRPVDVADGTGINWQKRGGLPRGGGARLSRTLVGTKLRGFSSQWGLAHSLWFAIWGDDNPSVGEV